MKLTKHVLKHPSLAWWADLTARFAGYRAELENGDDDVDSPLLELVEGEFARIFLSGSTAHHMIVGYVNAVRMAKNMAARKPVLVDLCNYCMGLASGLAEGEYEIIDIDGKTVWGTISAEGYQKASEES